MRLTGPRCLRRRILAWRVRTGSRFRWLPGWTDEHPFLLAVWAAVHDPHVPRSDRGGGLIWLEARSPASAAVAGQRVFRTNAATASERQFGKRRRSWRL